MDIYIKWNNDTESIQLPVLPSSFEVAGSQNNTSVNVHNLGEVNLKGKRNLFEISFSSFFPCQQYDFCRCEAMEPSYYVQTLQKILEDNTTVHVIITDTDCNFFCTLESFDYDMTEKTMDVGFNVSFKEYRVVHPVTPQATVNFCGIWLCLKSQYQSIHPSLVKYRIPNPALFVNICTSCRKKISNYDSSRLKISYKLIP